MENEMKCPQCGAMIDAKSIHCRFCGAKVAGQVPPQQQYQQQYQQQAPPPGAGYNPTPNAVPPGYERKSKLVAGILQLVFGYLGVGRFYLGYHNIAVAQLLVSIFTCGIGTIWPIIDGIMIITGSVPADGNGVPLKE